MIKKNILLLLIVFQMIGCKNNMKKVNPFDEKDTSIKTLTDYSGNYVTEEYHKRKEGFDWLVVTAQKTSDSSMRFIIQSRTDIKKPTCSFEGDGLKDSEGVFKAYGDMSKFCFFFTFKDGELKISKERNSDGEIAERFFCSGGASLLDYSFKKLNEPLDESQLKLKK